MLVGMDDHAHSGGRGRGKNTLRSIGASSLVAWCALTVTTRADIDPLSGIDFVRVGAVGNAPWAGDGTPGDRAIGRGGVGYEYSIGKYEVTSGQWAEFFTAVQSCPDGPVPFVSWPSITGGTAYPMYPTGGITWRTAAIFTNWLNNSKDNHLASFMNGAYDVGTFGYLGSSGIFTDQLAHNPGARYWIPTWDEWLKAAHYDPDKNGPGAGGWWKYSTMSDAAPVYGPPGVLVSGVLAQANAQWTSANFPGQNPLAVPLGAYALSNAWGLYDVAGGTSEWVEEASLLHTARGADGSAWATTQSAITDQVSYSGGDFPSFSRYDLGFRVASNVPAPGLVSLATGALLYSCRRRRKGEGNDADAWNHLCGDDPPFDPGATDGARGRHRLPIHRSD